MTTKSPWSNIGAWAAEAERADEEEKEAAERAAAERAASAAATPPASFPSLKDSVTAAGKQKKKTKMTLQEFTMGNSYNSSSSSRLTPEEMMRLPRGPQDRGDEMHAGIGGGFSNYGGYGGRGGGVGGGGRIRDYGDSEGGRRGYGGGFGEDDRRRGGARVSEFDQMPSRADEVDNWGAMKRSPLPSFDSARGMASSAAPGRPARYGDLGGGTGGFSKADEVDNWGSMKKTQPPPPSGQLASRSSFGSGFRNDLRPPGEADRWTKNATNNKELEAPVIVKVNKPNPFGAARPREEVLTEKGVDWKKLDEEIGVKKVAGVSRPGSSQSSRPGSSQSARSDGAALQQQQPQEGALEVPAVKPKPKVNPFGDAKPREVFLSEKGLDWRKIDLDLEHKRVDRPETDEEKNLNQEIENLKKDSLQKSDEEQANLQDEIIKKEKELEVLIRQLDDKIRFGQKNNERPGSGSGRYTGPPGRISSQPGPSEEPRGAVEFMDRPRSRGTVESWPRQNDDRRIFTGGRGRGGFSGGRDLDRSSPRNRW